MCEAAPAGVSIVMGRDGRGMRSAARAAKGAVELGVRVVVRL